MPYGLVTQKTAQERPNWSRVSGVPIFSWKGQRSRLQESKNHTKLASCLLNGRTRTTPLLVLIYCRRLNIRCSLTGRTAACHVGTWRRHAFLFHTQVNSFILITFTVVYFPVLLCLSVSVKWLAVKTASKMTYIVSCGALNSTVSLTHCS